jgi:predicted NBD/HSP70 family sugar kinase
MDLIADALEAAGVDENLLLGIGVGTPGMVDIRDGVVVRYPRIPGMDGYPLRDEIRKRFNVPVHLHNNAAVIALSEYRYGSVRGRQSVLTLVLRTGIGGAFIQDGTLFVNQHRTALEVGHTTVDPEGPRCRCGRRGCLETYLSEEALRRDAGAADVDAFFSAVAADEPAATAAVRGAADALLVALYGLLNSLNPEAVLIVTRSEALSSRLSDVVRAELSRRPPFVTATKRDIVPHAYDPVIAGQGAADLVFDSFFAAVAG